MRGRSGFALLWALIALTLFAAIVVAPAALAHRYVPLTSTARHREQALDAAESGAARLPGLWRELRRPAAASRAIAIDSGTASLIPLSAGVWWGEARTRINRATRTVQILLVERRLRPIERAALIVADSLVISDAARVVGADSIPEAWRGSSRCDSIAPSVGAGVLARDTSALCDGACDGRDRGRVRGTPRLGIATQRVGGDSVGGFSWGALRGRADVILPSGSVGTPTARQAGGTCLTTEAWNWGGSSGPCADHFPLIVADGDLRVDGGEGQGILLVRGRLELRGDLRFRGWVVALRGMSAGTGGPRVEGGVLLGSGFPAPASSLSDHAAVVRSDCALELASRSTAWLERAGSRAWAEFR